MLQWVTSQTRPDASEVLIHVASLREGVKALESSFKTLRPNPPVILRVGSRSRKADRARLLARPKRLSPSQMSAVLGRVISAFQCIDQAPRGSVLAVDEVFSQIALLMSHTQELESAIRNHSDYLLTTSFCGRPPSFWCEAEMTPV